MFELIPKYVDTHLTTRDYELCWQQCVNQQATSREDIQGMVLAFEFAKWYAYNLMDEVLDVSFMLDAIPQWGRYIDVVNINGFRSVPATFANGSSGEPPATLPQAIKQWMEAFVDETVSPLEAYWRFETIHPFIDGNGRVGHCIWAMACYRATGVWPTELPPDVFGADKRLVERFGRPLFAS